MVRGSSVVGLAAVVVAATACAPSSTSVGDQTTSAAASSDDATSTTSADASGPTGSVTSASTSTPDPDAGSDDAPPDATCTDDADCGELMCHDGSCHGCESSTQCKDGLVCWIYRCVLPEEAPACVGGAGPVCGDGEIGALEECDGSPGCTDCRRDEARVEWFTSQDVRSLLPLADGGVFTSTHPPTTMTRRDAGGRIVWTASSDHRFAFAEGPSGTIVGAESFALREASFPYVEARDAVGDIAWSHVDPRPGVFFSIAAGSGRVLVGGSTDQPNAAHDRGYLLQLAPDGAEQWSRRIDDMAYVAGLALHDDDAIVLGASLYYEFPFALERVDADGEAEWRVHVAPDIVPRVQPYEIAGDGAGGVWLGGDLDGGPWMIRYDAAGAEVDRFACFGDTAGWVTDLALGPDGRLAVGVNVTDGPLPIPISQPWIAIVEDGIVTSGVTLGDSDGSVSIYDLQWRADGRLVVGAHRNDNGNQVVWVVEP